MTVGKERFPLTKAVLNDRNKLGEGSLTLHPQRYPVHGVVVEAENQLLLELSELLVGVCSRCPRRVKGGHIWKFHRIETVWECMLSLNPIINSHLEFFQSFTTFFINMITVNGPIPPGLGDSN